MVWGWRSNVRRCGMLKSMSRAGNSGLLACYRSMQMHVLLPGECMGADSMWCETSSVCLFTVWGWVQPTVRTAALMVPPRATQYIPWATVATRDMVEDMVVKRRWRRDKLIEGFASRGKYSIEEDCNWIIRNCGHLVLWSQWGRMPFPLCAWWNMCGHAHIYPEWWQCQWVGIGKIPVYITLSISMAWCSLCWIYIGQCTRIHPGSCLESCGTWVYQGILYIPWVWLFVRSAILLRPQ